MISEIGDRHATSSPAIDDHIVPWHVSYRTTQLFKGPDPLRDDVGRPHRGHREPAGPEGAALDQRRAAARPGRAGSAGATEHRDTWWNDWAGWLAERAGELRRPPSTGSSEHPPRGDGAGGVRAELTLALRAGGGVGLHVAAVHREQRLLLLVGQPGVGADGRLGVGQRRPPKRRRRCPACVSSVSAETLSARAIDCSTRTEGSWRPRSSWLRYGLETWARSAICRSDRLASWRWARMNAPSEWSWSSRSVVIAGPSRRGDSRFGGGYRTGSRGANWIGSSRMLRPSPSWPASPRRPP